MTSGKRRAPEGTGADADTRNLPPARIAEDADPEQLTLWAIAVPSHPLEPAERDLRRFVNTAPRGRSHWWIADQRRRSA
jgi:hypothetical protein